MGTLHLLPHFLFNSVQDTLPYSKQLFHKWLLHSNQQTYHSLHCTPAWISQPHLTLLMSPSFLKLYFCGFLTPLTLVFLFWPFLFWFLYLGIRRVLVLSSSFYCISFSLNSQLTTCYKYILVTVFISLFLSSLIKILIP